MLVDWRSFILHKSRQPKNLFPTGTRVYTGHQGKGKTLSMVKYIYDIKQEFPKCVVFSNVYLKGIDYHYYNDNIGLKTALDFSNGKDGVLVVVDEAQLFFNKKDGISIDVFTAICQQRKDRRRLIFTCQIWEDLDISLRKQVPDIVKCNTLLGFIQINKILDGESLHYDKLESSYIADKKYTEIFKHNDKYYNRYDTYQKVITNVEYKRVLSSAAPPLAAQGATVKE